VADIQITRRRLLKAAVAAAAAWKLAPWPARVPRAFAQTQDPLTVATLEAFADTLIPGEKRSALDRAIAGAAAGPGAVQAGALAMMEFPAAGTAPTLPALAAGLDAHATAFAAANGILLDPTVTPFVALDFTQRTALLVEIIDGGDPDELVYFALAGIVFIAYHTAGFLHTTEALAAGHPGLAAIRFPSPDADGKWRFPAFSYRRALAPTHPLTRRGSPR
jgi:enediyne biosynthesis protein E8